MIIVTLNMGDITPLERLALERASALVGAPSIADLLRVFVEINLDAAVADYIQAQDPAQVALTAAPAAEEVTPAPSGETLST